MEISANSPTPLETVGRQTVTVQTDRGPKDVEVVFSGIVATVHMSAKPDNHGAVLDKKI